VDNNNSSLEQVSETVARMIAKMKQNNELLEHTSKMTKVGGWEYDFITEKHYWTLETYRIHEIEPSVEPSLEMGINHYAPEAGQKVRAAVHAAITHGTSYDLEVPFITAKGRAIWVHTQGTPVMEDGKVIKLRGSFQEITERKKAEQLLCESEARFKVLHNASFGGIAIHDEGIILDCNQGLSEMTGYAVTELIGMNGLLLIAEKSRNDVMNNIVSGYEKPYEATGLRKNGEEYPMCLRARNIPYKGKDVRVVEFRDITEQKQMEKTLHLTNYSINCISDSIFWVDKNANFLSVNDAACKNLGYTREELLTMNIFDVDPVFPEEKLEEHWEEISRHGALVAFETIHKTKDGRRIPVEVTTNLVEYGGQQYNCAVARDISARKQSEAKQKELEASNLRLQKAESLGQMAGGIAHLFNNYLYAVSGNLELALEELPKGSLIHDYLIEAMKATHRCADVSGSMLYYLGQNFLQTESLDITEFCRKNLSNFQSQSSANSGITIETDLIDTELFVRANAGQMKQVLNHLITNAYESIGENKGRISLVTKTIPASDISKFHLLPVDLKPSVDTYACLEVIDTGCGISKNDIHNISDPFFTTKFTGRGLGLAIVLGIVKSWGGCIGVRSEVGHGSTFMVFLPLSLDASISKTKQSVESPQAKPFSTILLVDDNTAVLKMTTIMLKKMGFEVISATNGVEAVEKFVQHKESVGCLITDLSMPELDGWGTLSEIRKINPHIPAILASGYDEAFAMSRDDSEKTQAFLHKPYTMKDLKSVLGQALDVAF